MNEKTAAQKRQITAQATVQKAQKKGTAAGNKLMAATTAIQDCEAEIARLTHEIAKTDPRDDNALHSLGRARDVANVRLEPLRAKQGDCERDVEEATSAVDEALVLQRRAGIVCKVEDATTSDEDLKNMLRGVLPEIREARQARLDAVENARAVLKVAKQQGDDELPAFALAATNGPNILDELIRGVFEELALGGPASKWFNPRPSPPWRTNEGAWKTGGPAVAGHPALTEKQRQHASLISARIVPDE